MTQREIVSVRRVIWTLNDMYFYSTTKRFRDDIIEQMQGVKYCLMSLRETSPEALELSQLLHTTWLAHRKRNANEIYSNFKRT